MRYASVSFALVCTMAASAMCGSIDVRAVAVNGTPVARLSSITISPGDTLVCDLFVSDWSEDVEPGVLLRGVQAHFDGEGWLSGASGALLPIYWDAPPTSRTCTNDAQCAPGGRCLIVNPPEGQCVLVQCQADSECEDPFPVCFNGECVGVEHRMRTLDEFQEVDRPDLLFRSPTGRYLVDQSGFETRFAAFVNDRADSVDDTGTHQYFGTIVLQATDATSPYGESSGEFEVRLRPFFASFIVPSEGPNIGLELPPLTVTVAPRQPEPESIPTVSDWGIVVMVLTFLAVARARNLRTPA